MAEKVKPLQIRFNEEIKPALMKDLKLENQMAVPTVEKIVLNIGAGYAKEDDAMFAELEDLLATISGQKPRTNKAKIAISNFKVRQGQPVGLSVTLRKKRMWYFLDKLINIALPRTKDFRGVPRKAFDGRGNYSLGIEDQTIFPEIDTSKNIRLHGLQISIITTAPDNETGLALLESLGFPFKKR